MMSENKPPKTLSMRDKQILQMPGEVDPKSAKVKVFMAIQKAKQKISKSRR